VLDRIARLMENDGFLVLGAAETVVGLTDSFKPSPDRRGLYTPSAASKPGMVVNLTASRLMAAAAR
jgi:chemotaxis protein methyltransferase CheR